MDKALTTTPGHHSHPWQLVINEGLDLKNDEPLMTPVVRFALEFRSSFGMDPFSGLLMPDGPAIPQGDTCSESVMCVFGKRVPSKARFEAKFPQQVLRKLCPRSINEDACKEALSEIKQVSPKSSGIPGICHARAPELLRAAALCNHLGQCSPEDECQIASQRTDGQIAEMDFWAIEWYSRALSAMPALSRIVYLPCRYSRALSAMPALSRLVYLPCRYSRALSALYALTRLVYLTQKPELLVCTSLKCPPYLPVPSAKDLSWGNCNHSSTSSTISSFA
eukprot:785490-Pelagomonas_calceolata.AAC.2